VVVLDDAGVELGPNQPGILAIDMAKSPLMWFSGYLNQATPALAGGYYRTGDSVEFEPDGSISFIGRSDDLITSSGYRIGPFDVESALIEHPAVIEAAVTARNLSARLADRKKGAEVFGAMPQALPAGALETDTLERALIAGKILCYAQGFEMLARASTEFSWNLPMPNIARIWRNGCIIRSEMLNDMASALAAKPGTSLIFAEPFTSLLRENEAALRKTVIAATGAGIAVPALAAGLSWFDAMRSPRGSANMIQAQRDFFGAHGFERLDGKDAPHGPWWAHAQ